MKYILLLFGLVFIITTSAFSQEGGNDRKGDFYIYWGWNRGWFTNSDISFTGDGYDFVLHDVVANDRQSEFGWDPYFKIDRITIPQYNLRLGYFFNHNYSVSLGVDHMKYVMVQYQTVKIDGEISNTNTPYNGSYNNDDIIVGNDLLLFEHTDGLNYINIEVRRYDELYRYKKVSINITEGFGFGPLIPKTNATLLSKERNDNFHLAGFGLGAVAGLNIKFWNHFFIQSEFKVGYINMPSIRTTKSEVDKAKQDFFFSQLNILFGFSFNLAKK